MGRFASIVLLVGLLVALTWAARRVASDGDKPALADVDAAWVTANEASLRRVLDLPPAARLEFKEVRQAAVQGFTVVAFELQEGERRRPLRIAVTQDGRWVLHGRQLYQLNDPFRPNREKIQLDNVPVRGAADAPVTVVEYSDYTCPYCRQFFQTTENPLLERYTGKVRFIYKNFPLPELRAWSQDAAVAAACAFRQGNDPFWAYHQQLFQQVPRLQEGRAVFVELARQAGLNLPNFESCYDQRATTGDVARDLKEAERLGVDGTPAFFVNGRPIWGLVSQERFFQIVDEELNAAQPH